MKVQQKFTQKQLALKRTMVAKVGISKAEALREVGYSESIARNPNKVITSELELEINDELQRYLSLEAGSEAILRCVVERNIKQLVFDEDVSDKVIRGIFEKADKEVLGIVFRKNGSKRQKITYYKENNHDAQLRAAELILEVHGLIGRNRKEVKSEATSPVFNTYVDMRKFLDDKGIM